MHHSSTFNRLLIAAVVMLLMTATIAWGQFTGGNVVVLQIGDGITPLSSNSAPVFLKEYTPSGTLVQTITLPSTGLSPRLTVTGTSTSEGHLIRSSDGNYLTLTGYDVVAGSSGFAVAGTPRVIARLNSAGTIDLTTALTDGGSGAVRSSVTDNGSNTWMTNSTVGLRYKAFGSSGASTQVTATPTNTRVVKIFNGQLYMTSGSGGFTCVNTVGVGTPTGSGNATSPLSGMPTASRSPYSFSISPDGNTMYVADDGSAASNGGIEKWTLSGGTWSNPYTLLNNGTTTTAVRGLTVDWSGTDPVIYATSSANNLIKVTDTGSGSTATTIASAPASTAFRGVDFTPGVASTQYRSVASGNWNATSTWESSTDGSTWVAATATPTDADGAITIRNPHTVTVTASVSADQVTIASGATLHVNNLQTLTIANGTGTVDNQDHL